MKSKLRLFLGVSALALAMAASSTAEARRFCVCTNLYFPVQCSNGEIYGNPCLANCAHATDCEPVVEEWQSRGQPRLSSARRDLGTVCTSRGAETCSS